MAVNLVLSCVYGVYMLQFTSKDMPPTLPMACVWVVDGSSAPNAALSYIGSVAVIAGNVVVFVLATWYLHSRAQRFYRVVQLVGIVLMTGVAIGSAVKIILLSQAFGRDTPDRVKLRDNGEQLWSFGQLLALLLLLLPVISIIEIYRGMCQSIETQRLNTDAIAGEIKVAPPVADDKEPLVDTEMPAIRNSFQPNPFFGSQTNLFRK